jgi:ATP-dependent 26S proteasome regulatory subunit
VVHFPNPTLESRQEYFRRMNPTFSSANLEEAASKSPGFSFAQLREAYIMAGQLAFERKDEISQEDLLSGIISLRESVLTGSKRNSAAGFQAEPQVEVNV